MHPLYFAIDALKRHYVQTSVLEPPRVVLDFFADVNDVRCYNQSPADPVRVAHVYAMTWRSEDGDDHEQRAHTKRLVSATASTRTPHVHVVRAAAMPGANETCLQLRALLTGMGLGFAWLDFTRVPGAAEDAGCLERIAQTLAGLCLETASVVCVYVDALLFEQVLRTSTNAHSVAIFEDGATRVRCGGTMALRVPKATAEEFGAAFASQGFVRISSTTGTKVLRDVLHVNVEPKDAIIGDVLRIDAWRPRPRL